MYKSTLLAIVFVFTLGAQSAFGRELRIVSFNTWGLKYGPIGPSKDIKQRFRIIPYALLNLDPDVILLQEVWRKKHRKKIIKVLKKYGYKYHAEGEKKFGLLSIFLRGIAGNGLLAVSKHPIKGQVKSLKFKSYTQLEEYFAQKGIMQFQVEIPGLGKTDFFNTHLGAVGFDLLNKRYIKKHTNKRYKQIKRLTKVIAKNSTVRPMFLTGDFNFHDKLWDIETGDFDPEALNPQYKFLKKTLNLTDSFRQFWPNKKGVTSSAENSYILKRHEPDARLDYVFYRKHDSLRLKYSQVVLDRPFPGKKGPMNLSDHYGVLSVWEIN